MKVKSNFESRISKQEGRRKSTEDKDVWFHVFDARTEMFLQKFINKGLFDTLDYAISSGKESEVYRATKGDHFYAVKIYRIVDSSFRNIPYYTFRDPRFKQVKNRWQEVIYLWALHEFRSLQAMHKAHVPVPKPVKVMKNVLIEECLESGGIPYPTLKKYKGAINKDLWNDIVESVELIYYNAKLVHGDLSEYNILIGKENTHYIIDVGQSLSARYPEAPKYLEKDLRTLHSFFTKRKVDIDLIKVLNRFGI